MARLRILLAVGIAVALGQQRNHVGRGELGVARAQQIQQDLGAILVHGNVVDALGQAGEDALPHKHRVVDAVEQPQQNHMTVLLHCNLNNKLLERLDDGLAPLGIALPQAHECYPGTLLCVKHLHGLLADLVHHLGHVGRLRVRQVLEQQAVDDVVRPAPLLQQRPQRVAHVAKDGGLLLGGLLGEDLVQRALLGRLEQGKLRSIEFLDHGCALLRVRVVHIRQRQNFGGSLVAHHFLHAAVERLDDGRPLLLRAVLQHFGDDELRVCVLCQLRDVRVKSIKEALALSRIAVVQAELDEASTIMLEDDLAQFALDEMQHLLDNLGAALARARLLAALLPHVLHVRDEHKAGVAGLLALRPQVALLLVVLRHLLLLQLGPGRLAPLILVPGRAAARAVQTVLGHVRHVDIHVLVLGDRLCTLLGRSFRRHFA
eukprot:m.11526 g.11526  ORF g.11526 m.11526 type:complete len:431 (+) comp2637_c0_seq1:897-2189(+)